MLMTFGHGRLVRDPELRTYGNEGKKLCRITIASDKQNGDGANYLDCTIFGKRGEAVEKYFRKGDAIVVMGNLDQNNYEDKNGNKRTSWALLVNDWEFAEKKGNGSGTRPDAPNVDDAFEPVSDDVPF